MKSLPTFRAHWTALGLALTSGLFGCEPAMEGEIDTTENAVLATNGLNSINGLNSANGLNSVNGLHSVNGLNSANGLNSVNGLSSVNGLMTTDGGRQTVKYLVRCAMPAGRNLSKADQTGTVHTFPGGLGLAPEWETGACAGPCQRWVSACMLAHINTAGANIPLWMVGQHPKLGWGQNPEYPNQEGTFFGNIFETNTAGHVDAYYCNGPGFDKNVVEGRIGSKQANSPYRNMFSSGYCNVNGCVASDAKTNNVSDGYKACVMGDGSMTAWNEMITVWRKNTAIGSNGQVIPGQTADGRTVRYDFEGNISSWTSGNTSLVLTSVGDVGGQTGTKSLKGTYASGASTLRMQGPAGLSLAAGTKVSFYLKLASDSKLTEINPFVKKAGGNEWKVSNPIKNLLKGSWNVVTITVPAGTTGNQVGVEFKTGGAFSAYVDAVTW